MTIVIFGCLEGCGLKRNILTNIRSAMH